MDYDGRYVGTPDQEVILDPSFLSPGIGGSTTHILTDVFRTFMYIGDPNVEGGFEH